MVNGLESDNHLFFIAFFFSIFAVELETTAKDESSTLVMY